MQMEFSEPFSVLAVQENNSRTCFLNAFPVKSTDTLGTLLVNEVICRIGIPQYLRSYQGDNLTINMIGAVYEHLGIEQTRTSVYHPQWSGGTI